MRGAQPFDSFNARALEPWEVARTFVPPPYFDDLAKKCHTVLVGPRGSGKTTVLKMLQSAALEAWGREESDDFRRRIDYSGVFVPADRAWGEQVAALTSVKWDEGHAKAVLQTAFTTHVLMAFMRALIYRAYPRAQAGLRAHRRISLDSDAEARLAKGLSNAWLLKPNVATLSSISVALADRMIALKVLSSRMQIASPAERHTLVMETLWLHLPTLESIVSGIENFEAVVGERSARWAFLFDELELAPRWIVTFLFDSMRSVDDRILLKLSLWPFTKLPTTIPTSPHANHDQETISLWFPRKEEAVPFCSALTKAILRTRGISGDVYKLLGPSDTEVAEEEIAGTKYHQNSRLVRRFRLLAERDPSFARYLRMEQIDLSRVESLSGGKRAETLRKVQAVVRLREALRGKDIDPEMSFRVRSRKNPTSYTGTADIFAITEGNPRILIGLMDRLLRNGEGTIPGARQATEIRRTRNLQCAFLRTIPGSAQSTGLTTRGILGLLNIIGGRFEERLLSYDFNPEPPGSFTVDARTSDDVLAALGEAVNAGAIIYVPDTDGELLLSNLRGKRFRLSYLLATGFNLPLTLQREISLEALLRRVGLGRQMSIRPATPEGESE